MKFLCDDNLGKLARYLRMLGYDTAYDSSISDAELIALMLKEDRIVITRDQKLCRRIEPPRVVAIDNDIPEEQLQAVMSRLGLNPQADRFLSRCLVCNFECVDVTKDDIKDEVFPYVLRTQEKFKRCPKCRRIYWQGSHYRNMVCILEHFSAKESND